MKCNGAMYLRSGWTQGKYEREGQIVPCPECQRPLADRLLQAGVRKSFADWKTTDALNDAYGACHELIDGVKWCVFLRGDYGTGKTHLAMATAGSWIDKGGSAVVVNVPDFLSELRKAIDEKDTSIDLKREAYQRVGLLVLDDLGAERSTEWTEEQLFQVIDSRYRAKAPMVVTSNAADKQIDPRVLSRLKPGEVLIRGAKDRRREFEHR